MKKKLQIFISSTFTDLIEERQAAVEAVLRAGNIPAGMELFSAGNKSQLDTIKKWIGESDIYILILGGRYGSLENESQISYTEIEYRYALELDKPFFAIVVNDEMMKQKVHSQGQNVLELENQDKYKKFKEAVLSKVCRLCKDSSEIKLAILESIIDIQNQFDLTGWIKGDEIPDNTIILNELEIIRSERDVLQKKVLSLETLTKKASRNHSIGDYTYEEISKVLEAKTIVVPSAIINQDEDWETNALLAMVGFSASFTTGVTATMSTDIQRFITNKLVPTLLNFGLVERQKVRNTGMKMEYDKFVLSALGNKFLSLYQLEKADKK
ncbi:uncharacterized protein DUF4062 [Flavobacterium limicola]|uniref:Uncharacterized protein DUF4062 n=1 Tax=Flavobacterium limicola TaxID=180441 RepID=A0A495S1V7_9FLAO|nr:DUF4062 domain-containing protein [Flavobacterium limicola]RKS93765.1 uncharacterized protein DUF4062 [Flavobacterium limicola]